MTSQAHAETPVAGISHQGGNPYLSEIEPQDIKDKIIIEEAITEYGAKIRG